jgi:hypothetical protein
MKAIFKEVRMRRAGSKVSGFVVGTSSTSPVTSKASGDDEEPEPVAGKAPAKTEAQDIEQKDLSRPEYNELIRAPRPGAPTAAIGKGGRDLTLPANNPLLL